MNMIKTIFFICVCAPLFGLSQVTNEYISLKPYFSNKITFNYTGSDQLWHIPAGVKNVFVDVMGAQGGTDYGNTGGLGGRVRATIKVTPNTDLHILVGGTPADNSRTAVYGGGGSGGINTYNSQIGSAGGGLSAITTSIPLNASTVLIIAGGGGGACGRKRVVETTSALGGDAGGITGSNGNYAFPSYGNVMGFGGTSTTGGNAATPFDTQTIVPTAGTQFLGGNGGSTNYSSSLWFGGGGGGAGWYGGGGGAGGADANGSGGGGSSYANTNYCVSVVNTGAYKTGNGMIVIYY